MIDNKTQVFPSRVLFPLVFSITVPFPLDLLLLLLILLLFRRRFSSSSLSCSASFASPFFCFASLVSIQPFSPHCIIAFFYWWDLLKLLPPSSPPSSFSLPFLLLTHSHFHYYPYLFVHHRDQLFLFSFLTLHSTRCLLRCVFLSVSFNATLRFCYVKLYISNEFRRRQYHNGFIIHIQCTDKKDKTFPF